MRSWLRLILSLLLILLILPVAAATDADEEESIEEVLIRAAETTPQLRDLRSLVVDLEHEMKTIRAQASWQLEAASSYSRGERKDDLTGVFGDYELLSLGFKGSRSFLSGFHLGGEVELIDRDPLDLEQVEDNLVLSLEGSFQLWPSIPVQSRRILVELEEELKLARSELEQAREAFYFELLQDYLELSLMQEELVLAEARKDLANLALTRAQRRAEIDEAGELELMQLELTRKQAENAINRLQRSLSSARDSFRQQLGEAPEPEYRLDGPIWVLLEEHYAPRTTELSTTELELLLEDRLRSSPEYQRLNHQLDWILLEKEWWQREQQPGISISAGISDLEAGEWQAALTLNYNFYQGGIKSLEKEEFEQQIKDIEMDIEELKESLEQQLISQLDRLITEQEKIDEAQLEKKMSNLEWKRKKEAYQRGVIEDYELEELRLKQEETSLRLLDAELLHLLSQAEMISSLQYLRLEEVIAVD